MLEKIISALSFLDLFQEPVTVLFRSKEKISTACNLILSFLVFAFLIFMFATSDMINKKNPKVSDQFIANSQTKIVLNNKNFGFILAFTDINYQIVNKSDPSYFTIEIMQRSIEKSKPYNKSYHLQNCEKKYPAYQNDCRDCFCFEKDSEIVLSLKDGLIWQDEFSFLSIQINACSNDTSPIPCKSFEEIWDYFKGVSAVISFHEYFFDFNDYENPQKINQLNFKELKINKNFIPSMAIYMMEINLYEDNHYLADKGEIRSGNYFQQDVSQFSSQSSIVSDEDRLKNNNLKFKIAEIYFYAGLNKRVIKRNYQKLTELLSQLGGLATVLKSVFGFISSFSIHVKLMSYIYKELYFFKMKKNQKNLKYIRKDSLEKNLEKEVNLAKKKIKTQREILDVRTQKDKDFEHLKKKETFFEIQNNKFINVKDSREKIKYIDKDKIIEKTSNSISKYVDKDKIIEKTSNSLLNTLEIKQNQDNFKDSISEDENEAKLFTLWNFIIQSIKNVFKMKEDDNSKLIAEIEGIYKKNFDIITIIKNSLIFEGYS